MSEGKIAKIVASVIVLIVIFGMWFLPIYSVWQQGLSGKAKLERAKQERQILIEQARAEVDSASW